jgi:hypothetical protein
MIKKLNKLDVVRNGYIIILCRSYYFDTVLNIYQLLYLLTVYNHIPVLQNY